jgi:hypothetical protein
VVYRNRLRLNRISEVSVRWDDGIDAPLPEFGEVCAYPLAKTAVERPVLTIGKQKIEIPFVLQPGDFSELEGGFWTHYSDQGQPVARTRGPEVSLCAGETAMVWDSKSRAEVAITALGEEIDAVKKDGLMPECAFAMPSYYAPSRGFDAPVVLPVFKGERRQVRLEILGEIVGPVVSVGDVRVSIPVVMRKGDRLLCRGGSEWILRDSKRKILASGKLKNALPVISQTTKVSVSCEKPDSADVRVLLSTKRVSE